MEMENEQVQPSYWNSVLIGSLITALIVTLSSIIGGYMMLGTEPSGAIFNSAQLLGTIGCLFGAVGGLYANWHYAKEYKINYKIGKGALIGLLVAVVATVLSLIMGQIWELIDPSYADAIIDWSIQNAEAMQLPPEAKEATIESLENADSWVNRGIQAGTTLLALGVLNVISGLIGAKVFASEE
jgi:hypothetical protein